MNDAFNFVFMLIASFVCLVLGYTYRHNEWQTEIAERTKINGAYAELLHTIYKSDTTYWKETIVSSKEYKELDSLRQGDWEDFYLY